MLSDISRAAKDWTARKDALASTVPAACALHRRYAQVSVPVTGTVTQLRQGGISKSQVFTRPESATEQFMQRPCMPKQLVLGPLLPRPRPVPGFPCQICRGARSDPAWTPSAAPFGASVRKGCGMQTYMRELIETDPRRSVGSPAIQTEASEGGATARDVVHDAGSAWIPAGILQAVGTALPALLFANFASEIAAASIETQSLIIAAEDIFFMILASLFLLTGEKFGSQRHPNAVPYPGPFMGVDGVRVPPAFFKYYVLGLPVGLGVALPLEASIWLALTGRSLMAASTLGIYLTTLIAQMLTEGWFIRRKSPMWGQVPQIYQTYRIWQLARGCWLAHILDGPGWLILLQEALILLWVFNFGVVMSWTPSFYRWHLQPPQKKAD